MVGKGATRLLSYPLGMLSVMSIEIRELVVFPGPDGSAGNPLGVVLAGASVAHADRQRVAAELNYSETVFVDDVETGAIEIFTPAKELDFAGHPTVGTAWLLAQEGHPVAALHPPAGTVPVRYDGDRTWVSSRPEWGPSITLRQLDSPAEVDAAIPPDAGFEYFWAWLDEAAGTVRSRSFPIALGIAEDEATGTAAVKLAGQLGRQITIHQGVGSVLAAGPVGAGLIEVGGRVATVQRFTR